MLENSAGEINITIGSNIIILPSQNVFELFLSKIFAAKSEKHNIGNVLVSVDKYKEMIMITGACLTNGLGAVSI